jgi:hypothetical protein
MNKASKQILHTAKQLLVAIQMLQATQKLACYSTHSTTKQEMEDDVMFVLLRVTCTTTSYSQSHPWAPRWWGRMAARPTPAIAVDSCSTLQPFGPSPRLGWSGAGRSQILEAKLHGYGYRYAIRRYSNMPFSQKHQYGDTAT